MPRNYVHLSGRDVDEAILRAYGLIKSSESLAPKVPIKCARCGNLCPHGAETCFRRGFALSAQVAFRKDDELQRLKEAVEQIKDDEPIRQYEHTGQPVRSEASMTMAAEAPIV